MAKREETLMQPELETELLAPEEKKQSKTQKIITWLVLISLILSIGFAVIRLIQSPTDGTDLGEKHKSDYILMIVQCLLGIGAMMLPAALGRRWRLEFPSLMVILYVVFLYAAVYLGEVRSFYYKYKNFDSVLHASSGAMLGALSFSVVQLLNRSSRVKLSPAFVAIFAFTFASTLGIFWEFYEYTVDGLLGLNMQKFLMEDGTPMVGRAALRDTMKDFMVNSIGSGAMSIIGYISLKYQKGWVEKLIIWRREPKKEKDK